MDARADTLSGRFGGQWAFLSTPPQHGQARSLPPSSSYLRSDRSNVSPLPTALHFHQLNASRSSLPRNVQNPSIGGNSSTSIPSQPVLLRVHSDDAAIQIRPTTRLPRPRANISHVKMNNELPPIQEYSIQGILAAIEEDIEEDVNAISEILGRSRLVLADQHDSHLPPQGEIRATSSPLQAVAEASSSNERLAAADNVLILREDASLIDGSHTGSAAYGLLERLQALPRNRRVRSDFSGPPGSRPGTSSVRNFSSPPERADMPAVVEDPDRIAVPGLSPSSRRLLRDHVKENETGAAPSRATNAMVSETYLSAGANATTISDPPVVSEGGRHYPLYSYDYSELFEGPMPSAPPPRMTFRDWLQSLIPTREWQSLASWVHGQGSHVVSAESQLREILDRQRRMSGPRNNLGSGHEDTDMYGS
ncbi:uncharacterized protein Z518_00858 [Rhinocladiella mackenziei CBS 650.93]|uniref:Rhinocladiella mackenziei CBS 650.93 unplaced genomic scaffold supercont1.1, whole genome shotgun sequence n=1 Tax=Rhinocladiella mackenziei CBS 650.93 TaxID=1442369 RepID=A0A0D2G4W3_9EURO|nr:uncharacterized protein Z518_00858 [Rhinocladiella mackenziei CBS 650.93]KIX09777.1 hypothetical protein Z518_00858 [Rhinocladiella mackenziei CBS 650.93]